jgi:hypothetical protein
MSLTLVASRPSHELAGPPAILEWKFGCGSAGLENPCHPWLKEYFSNEQEITRDTFIVREPDL